MTTSSPKLTEAELRQGVLDAVLEYHQYKFQKPEFIPGKTYIPVSGNNTSDSF